MSTYGIRLPKLLAEAVSCSGRENQSLGLV